MLVAKKIYTIQDNGQVTLPVEFRKKYGLKKGDAVVFKETEDGLFISSREALAMKLLDEIGAALKEKGVTLEELIENGRKIREDIYQEKYARDKDNE
jgi:AbrB family looped-hinge helix DNA binding protein